MLRVGRKTSKLNLEFQPPLPKSITYSETISDSSTNQMWRQLCKVLPVKRTQSGIKTNWSSLLNPLCQIVTGIITWIQLSTNTKDLRSFIIILLLSCLREARTIESIMFRRSDSYRSHLHRPIPPEVTKNQKPHAIELKTSFCILLWSGLLAQDVPTLLRFWEKLGGDWIANFAEKGIGEHMSVAHVEGFFALEGITDPLSEPPRRFRHDGVFCWHFFHGYRTWADCRGQSWRNISNLKWTFASAVYLESISVLPIMLISSN